MRFDSAFWVDLIWKAMNGNPPVVKFPMFPKEFDFEEREPEPKTIPVISLDCTRFKSNGIFVVVAPGYKTERKLEVDPRLWREHSDLVWSFAFDEIRNELRRAATQFEEKEKSNA